ncbi:hypothetical protein TNIN_499011 [Trichonephila inaurata madagascariensis]|uniref:Uncharacterized protein n=1 Tax=Trichonephila inaurata madagascariensis TaxID=2747483 RepID=A0A8X6WSD2_9ARAC|nr:hypothetical protein TNIN_499011 [Trichonephila inaurata madagascariensis]
MLEGGDAAASTSDKISNVSSAFLISLPLEMCAGGRGEGGRETCPRFLRQSRLNSSTRGMTAALREREPPSRPIT